MSTKLAANLNTKMPGIIETTDANANAANGSLSLRANTVMTLPDIRQATSVAATTPPPDSRTTQRLPWQTMPTMTGAANNPQGNEKNAPKAATATPAARMSSQSAVCTTTAPDESVPFVAASPTNSPAQMANRISAQ